MTPYDFVAIILILTLPTILYYGHYVLREMLPQQFRLLWWSIGMGFILYLLSRSLGRVHQATMDTILPLKTKEEYALLAAGFIRNPLRLILFCCTYVFYYICHLGADIGQILLDLHHTIRENLEELVDIISRYFGRLIHSLLEKVGDALYFAYRCGLECIAFVGRVFGAHWERILQFAREVGGILFRALNETKEKALLAWFGNGAKEEETQTKFIVLVVVFLFVVVIPLSFLLYWFLSQMWVFLQQKQWYQDLMTVSVEEAAPKQKGKKRF